MLANRIKQLRKSKGLNQVQLSEKLGVKKQSISNWENGNIMPSVDKLQKIADYFHVTTDYLLGRSTHEGTNFSDIDTTGLSLCQIEHVRQIVEDIRGQ